MLGDQEIREEHAHMTTLEMLEALASGITRLRAERAELVSALQEAEQRLSAISKAARPKTGRRQPVKTRRRENPPAEPASLKKDRTEREERHAGKRQALGKGLGQLRNRMALDRPEQQA